MFEFVVGERVLLLYDMSLLVLFYLDDVLILGRDQMLVGALSGGLASFLKAKGFCISDKSRLTPSQHLVWLGKEFDMPGGDDYQHGEVVAAFSEPYFVGGH